MKRNILLVDDEMPILLTLKAVLEISGFDVDIATSARDGKHKLHHGEYQMVITDMNMENERAGVEVVETARNAPYAPAVALLTAFPVADEDWQNMGADQMLVKPMQTRMLLDQIEMLLTAREERLAADAVAAVAAVAASVEEIVEEAAAASRSAKLKPAKPGSAKKPPARVGKPIVKKKATAKKKAVTKKARAKKAKKKAAKKTTTQRAKKTVKKVAKKTSAKRPRAAKKAARRRR